MKAGLELLVDTIDGCLYAAVVERGMLADLYMDPPTRAAAWATLYIGRVVKLDRRLNAALVDLGDGLSGWLPAKHIVDGDGDTGVLEVLRAGQPILVQIKSEAKRATVHEEGKLPRLTMKLYQPGIFINHHPLSKKVQILDAQETPPARALAEQLKLEGGGWAIRPGVDDATDAEITHELRYQQALWKKIQEAHAEHADRIGVLKIGPSALYRALYDYGPQAFEHIYVGSRELLDQALKWCGRHLPALADSKRLRLFRPEKPGQKLFDIYDVEGAIETLSDAELHLSCGGSIVLETTSAFTVIDVNQGSAETIGIANRAAALEAARQCRLRNLSGAILIDFINMDQKNERAHLMETLQDAFTGHGATTQVHGFTRLGIIEVTRKRRTGTLAEKLKKSK